MARVATVADPNCTRPTTAALASTQWKHSPACSSIDLMPASTRHTRYRPKTLHSNVSLRTPPPATSQKLRSLECKTPKTKLHPQQARSRSQNIRAGTEFRHYASSTRTPTLVPAIDILSCDSSDHCLSKGCCLEAEPSEPQMKFCTRSCC